MSIILCIFTEGCLVVGLTEGEMFSPHSLCWQFYRWANRPRDQHSPAQFFHLFFQRNFNLNKTHSNLLHTIKTHKKASGDKIEQVTAKIQKSWRTRVCEIWVQSKSTIQYNAPRSRFFWQTCLSTAIWLYHCVSALRFHTISSLFWPPRFWSVSLAMWLHLHLLHLF